MEFSIAKNQNQGAVLLRRFGYATYTNREGKDSYVRRIHGSDFPRFHLYVNKEDASTLTCSLHIDQRAPSYSGSRMHGGDYDSEVVRQEAARLQQPS